MIVGFKLKITCVELKTHCLERSKYHAEKAEQKAKELPSIKDAFEKIRAGAPAETVARMSKGGYNLNTGDTIQDLENDIRDHRNKSLVFRFFAEHLFEEDYVLDENDLTRLEIIRRWQ